jgi:hypothetical protein
VLGGSLLYPDGIKKILLRVSENLKNKTVKRAFASVLESERALGIALRPEFWKPRKEEEKTKASESAIIAARCMAVVIASRSPAMTRSTPNEQSEENPDILNKGPRHSHLLKVLNRFLENVALKFIDVEDIDIFLLTVGIVTEKLQLYSATQELRNEFEGHFTRLTNLENDLNMSPTFRKNAPTVRKNAKDLRSVLAGLRNPPSGNGCPPSGNGSSPPPMAQTDSPAAMSPVSPIQPRPPMASSPTPVGVYISMPSYPPTPSGETYPLILMPPRQRPHQTHHSLLQAATPTTITKPARNTAESSLV